MTGHSEALLQEQELALPRLLVVDDSRTIREGVRRMLADAFQVVEADNGETAWELISSDTEIQAVFSDLMMPGLNGFHLLRLMRESVHPRIRQLPVVIMTGLNDDERLRRKAMLMGATDFITKPFDAVQLRARARSAAQLGQAQRKLERIDRALALESALDPHTGLVNRRYLIDHAPAMLAHALRRRKPLSLIRIEIDDYAALERNRGAALAEKTVACIAELFTKAARPEDVLARIGAAGFALLAPDTGQEAALRKAERLQGMLRRTHFRSGGSRFRMTASAAVATAVPVGSRIPGIEALLAAAEAVLGDAMLEGGDRLLTADAGRGDAGGGWCAAGLSVDACLARLQDGDAGAVRPRLRPLLQRVFPLLVYADRELGLDAAPLLARLRERLAGAPPDA